MSRGHKRGKPGHPSMITLRRSPSARRALPHQRWQLPAYISCEENEGDDVRHVSKEAEDVHPAAYALGGLGCTSGGASRRPAGGRSKVLSLLSATIGR
eukprot:scaffold216223_cov40-Tisochrysis_lutea.AAC.3